MNPDDQLMNSPADHNPYEPPDLTAKPAIESSQLPLRTVVQRFRRGIHALAGIAIFCACLTALVTFSPTSGKGTIVAEIVLLPGIVVSTGLLGLGVQVARKKMWAVRVLMIVAYAALGLIAALWVIVPSGAPFRPIAVIPAAVLGFVVVQCHRVIGFSRTMTAAGIPLNMKPYEIHMNQLTPMYATRGHE
jgi:formate hydrogenlyase subunit 4